MRHYYVIMPPTPHRTKFDILGRVNRKETRFKKIVGILAFKRQPLKTAEDMAAGEG